MEPGAPAVVDLVGNAQGEQPQAAPAVVDLVGNAQGEQPHAAPAEVVRLGSDVEKLKNFVASMSVTVQRNMKTISKGLEEQQKSSTASDEVAVSKAVNRVVTSKKKETKKASKVVSKAVNRVVTSKKKETKKASKVVSEVVSCYCAFVGCQLLIVCFLIVFVKARPSTKGRQEKAGKEKLVG